MLIAFPSCATWYFVEPASLQPNGRRARRRCLCRNEPSRAKRLMAAAEALAPDALVGDALVTQWRSNSTAAPAKSPEVRAEVVAAEPNNDAQEAAEKAPGEPEPAEATAAVDLDAPIVPGDLDEGRPPIDIDAQPIRLMTVADHKDIGTEVPRLKLLLRNTAEQEVYPWTAAPLSDRLPPGKAIAFASRLASAPAGNSDVLVRFLDRHDPIADPR
jgi:hypothetical protein